MACSGMHACPDDAHKSVARQGLVLVATWKSKKKAKPLLLASAQRPRAGVERVIYTENTQERVRASCTGTVQYVEIDSDRERMK